MNEQKERQLDELITRTINTTKPEFNPERWKQKYPEEFEILKSWSGQDSQVYHPKVWRLVLKSPTTRFAAAAVIIVSIGLFVFHHQSGERIEPLEVLEVKKSPAELTTFASLTFAYRRGGIELVEKICDRAITLAGPRPAEISVQNLLEESNGRNSERTKL
jgi:hypothetical protein